MRNPLLVLALLACIVLSASNSFALAQVQVTGISDFALGTWGLGDPAVSNSMDLCIGSLLNSPAGGYAVTVTSSTGSYALTNGSNQIPYSLYWDASGAGNLGSQSTQLTNGIKLTGIGNANSLSATCILGLTGADARLTIKITQSSLTAARAGTYTGTITLLISPN